MLRPGAMGDCVAGVPAGNLKRVQESMKNGRRVVTIPPDTDPKQHCPQCKSVVVLGLVAAFWVNVNEGPDKIEWQSESEIGSKRMCGECKHEWEE
jgi:hypothetical protein